MAVMGFRDWSRRLDRSAQARARQRSFAPTYLFLGVAFLAFGAFIAERPAAPLTVGAVNIVIGTVSLAARWRDRKRS